MKYGVNILIIFFYLCLVVSANDSIQTRSGILTTDVSQIKLNGKIISEGEGARFSFLDKKYSTQSADIVLISYDTGASCSPLYKFITIPINGLPFESSSFGNCKAALKTNQNKDTITVIFPKDGNKGLTVSYKNGNVIKK